MVWATALRASSLWAQGGLVIAAFASATSHAQPTVAAGIGAVIPIGSTADILNSGFNAAFSVTLRPSWSPGDLRIEGATNELSRKPRAARPDRIQSATVNLVLLGVSEAGPTGYVVVGAGSYQFSGVAGYRGEAGMNAGAGIRFRTGVVFTYVEARFHYVLGEPRTKLFPMTLGLAF